MTAPTTRTRLAALAGGLAVMITAGCTGGDTPSPSPTPDGVARRDVNAHDRGALQQGGTLRQAVSTINGSWNPLITGRSAADRADLDRIREPLLPRFCRYDDAGVPTPDPDFLISATQTAADPTTITYQLNPKAVWGDGSPVDGDDMIATWKACNGSNTAFRCDRTDAFDKVADVSTGADKFTVTVRFDVAYPDWTEVFDSPGVLKAESVADPATFNDGWGELKNDWLAGPFRFDAIDTGQGVLTEVPNDRWWGQPPLLDQLLWRRVPVADRGKAYADRRLDSFAPAGTEYAATTALPSTTVRSAAGPVVREVVLNTSSGPLADQAVRQALARAIDRPALIAADLQGTGGTADPLGSRVFLPDQPGYLDQGGSVAFDLALAQSELDAAGWAKGTDGFRSKEGAPLQLDVLAADADPLSGIEARLLTSQLDAAGVRSEVQTVTDLDAQLTGGQFALAVRGRGTTRSPYDALRDYVSGAPGNVSRLALPAYDTMVQQAATQLDPTQRAATANQADLALWSAVPSVPLYQRPDLVAVPATLANFGAFGLSSVDYTAIGYLR